MIQYKLATSASFWKSRDALDGREKTALADALEKLQKGLPGVNVHKLEASPYVSFYVNRDAMRVICHREEDLLICLHVCAHDAAYAWAKRHRVVQVGSYVRIVRSRIEDDVDGPLSEANDEPVVVPGPLAAVTDDDFGRFDVHSPTAEVLRAVPNVDVLLDLMTHFPPARANAVLDLATDAGELSHLEKTYRKDLEKETEAPSLSSAISSDVNAADFWIPNPSDEAYRHALRGQFDAWRVFLHPAQRQVVRVSAKGAVKVTGGPGTGKTVVALHRARHLAEKATGDERILLTTFSNVLAEQLADGLDQLCGAGSATRDRIVVRSLVSSAQDTLRGADQPASLITDPDEYWEEALQHDKAGRGRAFYVSEREHVLAVHGCWTEDEYIRVRRTGRGSRLDRPGRREVWKVLSAFDAALRKAGGGDVIALCRDAAALVREGTAPSPYTAVVCDEVQDVGASELRFLAALATDPETKELRPNGLTLCGDGHQRIYRVPFTLRSCGIDVRGRASRVLRLNYRTTESIRRAAVAVVKGIEADELEDEGVDALRGYRSLRRGHPPEERSFASPEEEAAWIAELAEDRSSRLMVLARKRRWLTQLRKLLRARGVEPRLLQAGDKPGPDDGLILCTLHRSKGLEAPRVVIAGRQLVPARYPGGGDPADKALWARKERCLLYVGMTRARDWCGVSRVG